MASFSLSCCGFCSVVGNVCSEHCAQTIRSDSIALLQGDTEGSKQKSVSDHKYSLLSFCLPTQRLWLAMYSISISKCHIFKAHLSVGFVPSFVFVVLPCPSSRMFTALILTHLYLLHSMENNEMGETDEFDEGHLSSDISGKKIKSLNFKCFCCFIVTVHRVT